MSDAPERIAVWPDFVGHPSMTGQWSANTHPDNAVAYVRADLSDALLREAMEALGKLHHAVCGETGFAHCVRLDSGLAYPWPALDDADEPALATLAKLRAHLGEME